MTSSVIVDDHDSLRDSFRIAFETAGDLSIVAETANANEALDLVRRTRPDLVLMDVCTAEGASGLEATRQIRKSTAYSKHVTSTMQYIRDHLNEELNLSGIASYVCLNASYLSALFHEETGMTVMDYIQECRVEWAENLLRFSDYSILEISNITSFSSQSYFGAVFRKRTGLTPGEYRKKYYRKGVLQRRKVTKERKGDLLALE